MPYLAIADADRVQEYVFSPQQLRYVRGASRLQTLAIENIRDLANEYTLYANGGVVLAELPTEQAAGWFCDAAAGSFRKHTRTATVSTAICPRSADGFRKDWKRVRDALEQAKRQRNSTLAYGSHWLWATCERCGERSSNRLLEEAGNFVLAVCDTCEHKHRRGARNEPVAGFEQVEDFEQLAALSRPSNYLALIYIDLDRLGRYLDIHVETPEQCHRISSAIDRTVRNAVREAGKSAAMRSGLFESVEGRPPKQPFVELMAGGDDAIVMLAAQLAIPFLAAFREEFEAPANWQGMPAPPPFSAGMVFAHHRMPIGEFVGAAKRLYRKAKLRKDTNSVAFQVASSSMIDDPDASSKPTANPYTLDEFLTLADTVVTLKALDTPRSKIHALYDLAWKPKMQGIAAYSDLLLRLPYEQRAPLLSASGPIGPGLWRYRPDGTVATSAADLAELWEFVHA